MFKILRISWYGYILGGYKSDRLPGWRVLMTLNEPNGQKISGKLDSAGTSQVDIFICKYFILVYAYQNLIYKMKYWYSNSLTPGDKDPLKKVIHLLDHLNRSHWYQMQHLYFINAFIELKTIEVKSAHKMSR